MTVRTVRERWTIVDKLTDLQYGNHTYAEAVSRMEAMRRAWQYKKIFTVEKLER